MNPDWIKTLAKDVGWFHDHCPERGLLDSFKDDWETFAGVIREKPGRWKSWLKTALQRHMSSIQLEHEWFSWHADIRKTLLDHGYQPKKMVAPAQLSHYCLQCCRIFRRRSDLAVHSFKKHDRVRAVRHFVIGVQCESCLKTFDQHTDLLNHASRGSCYAFYAQRGIFVDRQPGVNSRQARQPLRDPFVQGEGPACPPLDTVTLSGPLSMETQNLRQRWTEAWCSDPLEDKLELLRQATLGTYLYHEEILDTFDKWWQELLLTETVYLQHLGVHDAFVSFADGEWFLQDTSSCQRPEMRESCFDFFELESQSLDAISLDVPRPVQYKACVIAHLFSGARRPGDFQSHIEAIGGTAISIDIVFDLKWGDLLNHDTFMLFDRALREGVLPGYLAGAQTWSRARAVRSADYNVRPVRDRRRPYGLLCLNKKEASQVLVGTKLLGVSMRLFCTALLYRATAVIEHPAEPTDLPEAAAIWRTALVQFDQRFRDCDKLFLFQGHFGGHSAKPTEFLVAHGECLKDHLISGRTSRLPRGGCIGRTEQGEWATSKLKEYPSVLCSSLFTVSTGA